MKLNDIIFRHTFYFYLLFISLTFFLNRHNVFAQNIKSTPNTYSVEFVESISSSGDVVNNSFLDKLSDLVFGSSSISFRNPISLVADTNNNIIVLDQGLQNIISLSKKNNFFITLEQKKFPSLVGVCFKNSKEILFTDSKLNKVFIYNTETKLYKILNDTLDLIKPTGIAYSTLKKEIWVVETGKHSIVILDDLGNLKKRIGVRGNGKAEFNFPTSIWIDKDNIIYIVDAMNFRIQLFDSQGTFLSMFGKQGDATGYFARPKGIATDSFGNIYIVDALFHNVQIFDKKGNFLSNFGAQGNKNGNFWLPNGLFIDKNNRIYIADSYNARIQIFQLKIK